MRRVASISLLLLLLSAAPGVAAGNPPAAPTLTAVEGPVSTTLTWSAPSGTTPASWLLVRDASDDRFDHTEPLAGTETGYTDRLIPLPGESFTYTVTYVYQGDTSLPSAPYVRDSLIPCSGTGFDPDGCCPIAEELDCAKAEACTLLGHGFPVCAEACLVLDNDLLRRVHDIVCTYEWDLCDTVFERVPMSLRNQLEGTCRRYFP